MAAKTDLIFDIIARDRATRTFRDVGTGVDGLGGKIASFAKAGAAAVAAFAVAGAAAFAAFAFDGVKKFAALEKGMNEVFTLMPDLTDQAMGQMTDDVRKFAREAGVLHEKVVPALYQAISAGVPKDNVFDFLHTAVAFSKGGVTELETAVDSLSSVVNAYGANVIDAQRASDLLFTAIKGGKTNASQLGASLFNVIPTAAALKVEFGQITAALATLTAQGTPTSVATTQMRQLLVELSKAGGKAAKTFEDMSGKSFRDFVAKGGTVEGALKLMEKAAKRNGLGLADMFSSVEAGNAALGLTGAGAEKYAAELVAAADAAGATDAAHARMEKGISAKWEKLMVLWNDAKVALGEKLAPGIEAVLDMFDEWSKDEELQAWLQETGAELGKVADEILPVLQQAFMDVITAIKDNKEELALFAKLAAYLFGFLAVGAVVFAELTVKAIGMAVQAWAWFVEKFNNFIFRILTDAERAFGWIPGLGPKLKKARSDFAELARGINAELSKIKDKTVNVNLIVNRDEQSAVRLERRAHGGPVNAGQPYIVGDGGRPEVFVPNESGYIMPSVPQAFGASGAGGSAGGRTGGHQVIELRLSGADRSFLSWLQGALRDNPGVVITTA